MEVNKCAQTRYNFLLGGDGLVYEGRGWDHAGNHTSKYDNISIGIGFMGNYDKKMPTPAQLRAGQLLLAQGVRLKKLSPKYQLFGQRQLIVTNSPGENLYNIIKTWPHFANQTVPLKNETTTTQ